MVLSMRCTLIASFALISTIHQTRNTLLVNAFTITPSIQSSHTLTFHDQQQQHGSSTTRCWGRKRGKLTQNVSSPPPSSSSSTTKNSDEGTNDKAAAAAAAPTVNSKQRKNTSSKKKGVAISSSLADWAAASSSTEPTRTTTTTPPSQSSNQRGETNDNDAATEFTPFTSINKSSRQNRSKKGISKLTSSSTVSSPRRERQAQRQAVDGQRQAALATVTTSIRDILEENFLEVSDLIRLITRIITEFGSNDSNPTTSASSTTTVKSFFQTKSSYDYTLAWVGSDDAICHVGTGLHKVPLARLQDIFVTVGNIGLKSTSWRMMEVIRILGPFPNVRNTLLGQVMEFKKSNGGGGEGRTNIKIRYDSIVDGIGKQLNAGTEEDKRFVNLDVLYADEEVIICVVPPAADTKDDGTIDALLGEGGKNVLLFLKEDEMEEKLELARVAG